MKEVSTISKRKSRSRPQNRRQQPRPVNKGYGDAGASWHKKATKGFRAMSGSPKEDIDANNYTLRQRARMLYMAAPIATSAIRTNRTNVVGIGLQLKSRIDREALGPSVSSLSGLRTKGRATPPASTTSQPCSSSHSPRGWSAATCSPS